MGDTESGNVHLAKLEGMNQRQAMRIIVGSLFDSAPTVVNLMVPMLALCLKAVYRREFYINHLVLSLLIHAVGLILLGVAVVAGNVLLWVGALSLATLHLGIAMQRVYSGIWWKTGLKLLAVLVVYGGVSVVGVGTLFWLAILSL